MKCDNLAESLKRVKSENSGLVSEKKKLEKKLKQKSKEDVKFTTGNNNNKTQNSTKFSSNTSKVSLTALIPPPTKSEPNSSLDSAPQRTYNPVPPWTPTASEKHFKM